MCSILRKYVNVLFKAKCDYFLRTIKMVEILHNELDM